MIDVDSVSSRLDFVANDLREKAKGSLARVSEMVAEEARRVLSAQVINPTGRLEQSITANSEVAELAANVTASAPYAAFVEYGTSRQAAKPFMTPAMMVGEAGMLTMMASDLSLSGQ